MPLSVRVNVSVIQLNSTTFVQDVLRTVNEVGLPPQTLILELTESMLLEDTAHWSRRSSRRCAARAFASPSTTSAPGTRR